MMSRYITKESFTFVPYNCDPNIPITVGKGVLVSYEIYTHEPSMGINNAIKITVHGPNSDIILDGPRTCIFEEYLREIEFDDLVHPKEYFPEKEYNEEYKRKCIQTEKDEDNHDERINTAAVLNYFREITESEDPMDERISDWITSEVERLKGEMKRLDVLAASDGDIIQTALTGYYQEHYSDDVEIANKITDVRNRYLEMINSKEE